jgi:predicted DNA-binding protein
MVEGGVPRPPSGNDEQIAIRLPKEWLARADKLSDFIAKPGVGVTRSDVLRAALARGLDALEDERRKVEAKPAKPTRAKR